MSPAPDWARLLRSWHTSFLLLRPSPADDAASDGRCPAEIGMSVTYVACRLDSEVVVFRT